MVAVKLVLPGGTVDSPQVARVISSAATHHGYSD